MQYNRHLPSGAGPRVILQETWLIHHPTLTPERCRSYLNSYMSYLEADMPCHQRPHPPYRLPTVMRNERKTGPY
jgi:hypothetical protein